VQRNFNVGDYVFIKVKQRKISLNIGSSVKISPRYCRSFEFLDRIGPFAYRIAFLANIEAQNVFHVSLLKKYVHDPNHVLIDWVVI